MPISWKIPCIATRAENESQVVFHERAVDIDKTRPIPPTPTYDLIAAQNPNELTIWSARRLRDQLLEDFATLDGVFNRLIQTMKNWSCGAERIPRKA